MVPGTHVVRLSWPRGGHMNTKEPNPFYGDPGACLSFNFISLWLLAAIMMILLKTKDPCSLAKCHGFSMYWPIKEHVTTSQQKQIFSVSHSIFEIFSRCIITNAGLVVNCRWWMTSVQLWDQFLHLFAPLV